MICLVDINPALVQAESGSSALGRRIRASALFTAADSKPQGPRLATLATQVRLDAFARVKKAMVDMIALLLADKADEIKLNDFRVDEFNKNQL